MNYDESLNLVSKFMDIIKQKYPSDPYPYATGYLRGLLAQVISENPGSESVVKFHIKHLTGSV